MILKNLQSKFFRNLVQRFFQKILTKSVFTLENIEFYLYLIFSNVLTIVC